MSDPTADPTMTLVVGAMILLSLALLGAVIYLVYSYATRDRLRVAVHIKVPERPIDIWGPRIFSIAVLVGLVIGSSYYVGRPAFCANCHTDLKEAKALAQSAHKGVPCLACHQTPGVSGALAQKVDYSRWLVTYAMTSKAQPGKAYVSDNACLSCHDEITRKTVTSNSVRVRHSDFLKRGGRCMDCHNTVAHATVVKLARTPSMTQCVKCHNDKTAKADCVTCHRKDIGGKMRQPKRSRLKIDVFVKWDFCYRCHKQQKCTQCHGVQMPHPPDWVSGGKHAAPAFNDRTVCWRCHDLPNAPLQPAPLQSCSCHGPTDQFHVGGWRTLHGPVALGQTQQEQELQNCYECHSTKLCDFCHTPGKYTVVPIAPPPP